MKVLRSLLLAVLAPACMGKLAPAGTTSQLGDASDGGDCHFPTNVQVSSGDSGAAGCFAHAPGMICAVSNGATVLPDGGVINGTETCSSICDAVDYEMTCASAGPDPSLGCQIIPIPTPSDVAFYCCPCAE